MEYVVLLAAVVLAAVLVLWRRERRLGRDLEARRRGLPDDQRDKNVGMLGLPNRGRPWGRGG